MIDIVTSYGMEKTAGPERS